MLRRVALVRTDVSEEALGSYETSVLTEPLGLTSQKTPFFTFFLAQKVLL
jgi:hypothetical protein